MLSDGGDKVARGEDLKVAVDLGVHPGAIDDGAVLVHGVGGLELHFLKGERVANNVTGDALQVLAFVGLDAATAVNVETGMFPAPEHAGAVRLQQALFTEEGDELGAEKLFDRIHAVLRQDQEAFVAQKESVGHE